MGKSEQDRKEYMRQRYLDDPEYYELAWKSYRERTSWIKYCPKFREHLRNYLRYIEESEGTDLTFEDWKKTVLYKETEKKKKQDARNKRH